MLVQANFGKLYVTNSEFPNGIGLLCVIILYLISPSVKAQFLIIRSNVLLSSRGELRSREKRKESLVRLRRLDYCDPSRRF